jgi:hypothetical protein
MNTLEVMRRVLTAYETHDLLGMEEHMQDLREVMANTDNPKMYWQSLTDGEHVQLAEECGCMSADWVFYGAAVERKVKNKQAALFESLIKEAQIAAHAKRLALELESLLLATHDTEAVSTWWQSAYQAMHNYQDDVDRLYPQDHVSPLGKD